jgi:hypothetical protein
MSVVRTTMEAEFAVTHFLSALMRLSTCGQDATIPPD